MCDTDVWWLTVQVKPNSFKAYQIQLLTDSFIILLIWINLPYLSFLVFFNHISFTNPNFH